ncbi:MAG: hypothetical protein GXY42_02560 [Desulfovibrionales bacterium]|nr:hypothetical protein [Desulfovibrionales bacterium]
MVIRLLASCLLVLTLAGCAATRPSSPDTRFYTLEYDPPLVDGQPCSAVIQMTRFGVAPEFNTTKLVYRDLAFGRQEYAYHQWRGTPQALVADYLRRDMQKSGLFMAVAGPNSSMPATHQLEGVVEEWMELDQAERWLASAELTIILLDVRTGGIPDLVIFQRTYKTSEPCAKKNPASVAEAMSRVMRNLSQRIVTDVHAAVRN